jgi:hypothetical protein
MESPHNKRCMENRELFQIDLQKLASLLAREECIDVKDVCLTMLPNAIQARKKYKIVVNLFLPSIDADERVKSIQKKLHRFLLIHLSIRPSEIFIMTSIICSGNVLVNGAMIMWQQHAFNERLHDT